MVARCHAFFPKTGLRFPQAIGRVLHEAKRGKCRETNFFYIIICCSIWREMLQQRTLYKKLQLCLYLSYFRVYSRSSTWQCSDPLRPVASCQILLQGPYFNLVNAQWFRLIEIVGQIGLLTSILIAQRRMRSIKCFCHFSNNGVTSFVQERLAGEQGRVNEPTCVHTIGAGSLTLLAC